MEKELKILITENEIQKRVKEVADSINKYFKGEELTVICVLKGAVMFFTDLIKKLDMPITLEFVRLSSYLGTSSSGKIKALDLTLPTMSNKNVLIVEDIIDTGVTMRFLTDYIKENLHPACLKIATFADKKIARKNDLAPDFYCFEVDDKFIVGYGLDIDGKYRNLPFVGYF